MSVYVDPLMACLPNARWKWHSACHMFADSLAELHDFAARIGLRHTWFQRGSRIPHYDLTPGKRREAVAAGAVELTASQTVEIWIAKGWTRRAVVAGSQEPVAGGETTETPSSSSPATGLSAKRLPATTSPEGEPA